MEKRKSKPGQLLMEAIGFDEEDLEANREGQMSVRQLRNLSYKWTLWTWFTLVAVIITYPTVCFLGLAELRDSVFNTTTLIAAALLVIPAYLLFKWWRLNTDLRQRIAANVEGSVRLDYRDAGDGDVQYNITIEKTVLRVKRRIFFAFKNGDPYRVYYAPHTKTLLSAEWLREG